MACQNITLNGLGVGCKDGMGGIKCAYIIKYDDVDGKPTIGTSGDTKGMITAIATKTVGQTAEKFHTFNVRRQTSNLTSTISTDDANGTFSVQSDLALQFSKMTTEKSSELAGLMVENLAVIVLDCNGKYWYLGFDNYVACTAGTMQTGTAIGDLNGYNITLTDYSNRLPYEVDSSIISSLVADAPVSED